MTDYVIGKKRRRSAIDPCLGYYMRSQMKPRAGGNPGTGQPKTIDGPSYVPTSFDAEQELEMPLDSPSESNLVPVGSEDLHGLATRTLLSGPDTLAVAHEQTTTADSSIYLSDPFIALTVESFLNHSAKVRTYGGRKRPTKRLGAVPNNDDEDTLTPRRPPRVPLILSDDDSDFGKPSQQPSSNIDPKMRRRRKRKPWKDRIYEAAIATHCVPDDCFIQSLRCDGAPADQTRAPLHFVPCSPESPHAANLTRHSPSHSSSMKKQLDTQRTRTVMRTSTFSDRHTRFVDAGILVNSLDRLPLSKWRLNLDDRDQTGLTQTRLKTTKRHKKEQATHAMDVAARDVAYAPLTFISLDEAEIKYKTMFADHGARKTGGETPDASASKLLLVDEAVSSAAYTDAAMSLHLSDLPDDQQPRLHEEGLPPIACLPQSPAVSTASELAEPSAEGNIRLNEVGKPPPSPEHRVLARNGQPQKDQQAIYRPLKPLGSLTDAFLSNIRTVSRP